MNYETLMNQAYDSLKTTQNISIEPLIHDLQPRHREGIVQYFIEDNNDLMKYKDLIKTNGKTFEEVMNILKATGKVTLLETGRTPVHFLYRC